MCALDTRPWFGREFQRFQPGGWHVPFLRRDFHSFSKKKSQTVFAQNAGGPNMQLALFCSLNGSCLIKGVVRSVSGSGKTLETNDTFIFFRSGATEANGLVIDRSETPRGALASLGSTRSRTLRAVKSERESLLLDQVLSRTVEDSSEVLKSKSHINHHITIYDPRVCDDFEFVRLGRQYRTQRWVYIEEKQGGEGELSG